jgi:hypothetical protein
MDQNKEEVEEVKELKSKKSEKNNLVDEKGMPSGMPEGELDYMYQ